MPDDDSTQTDTEKLYGLICSDVDSRTTWDDRQAVWYKMRHDGLRAQNKPWEGSADLHFPLIDTQIDKFKPFYLAQLFGTDLLAQFIALSPQLEGLAVQVSQWFDYKLKQESNLEAEMHIGIDKMLGAGHVPVKVYWDAEKKRVAFDAVEPIHCIVPDQTEDPEDADRITFVHHFTPEGLKRDPRFQYQLAQDDYGDDFVKRITGRGESRGGGAERLKEVKEVREGITHSGKDSDNVIVWEVWKNTEDGWWVYYFSPLAPEMPLRVPQRNPYKHGKCPVVRFDCEIKDKGWYGSRGIPEKLAPFEQSLCKTWNDKHNAMTLFNRPLFTSSMPIPNAGNLRMNPGQILPGGVQAVTMPRPPVSFDEEMNNTRTVAEGLIGSPDFGIKEQGSSDARTATEVNRIGQQNSSGIQLRSKVFLMALRRLLGLAWETLIQYDQSTTYFIGEKVAELPNQALQLDGWSLQPNASSETWDRAAQYQRAVMNYQMFGPPSGNPQGSPFVNQAQLVRQVLEKDDPRKVSILFQDPQAAEKNEMEDEQKLIPSLMLGAPFAPKPNENQAVRIKVITDFITAQDHLGVQLPPMALQGLQARVQAMMAMLQQKSPQQAQQVQMMMQQQAAQNVIPMQQPALPGAAPEQPQPDAMPV